MKAIFCVLLILFFLTIFFQLNVCSKTHNLRVGGLFLATPEDQIVRRLISRAFDKVNEARKPWQTPRVELVWSMIDVNDDQYITGRKVCSLISSGIMAIMGPSSPTQFVDMVSQLGTNLDLPHLKWRLFSKLQIELGFSINLSPTMQDLTSALIDLVEYFKWPDFVFLYDSGERLNNIEGMMVQHIGLASEEYSVYIRKYQPETLYDLMRNFKKNQWRRIVVDMNMKNTEHFLQAALNLGMVNRNYHFILTNLDALTLNFSNYQHNYVNITALTLHGVNFTDILANMIATPTETPFYADDRLNTNAILAYDAALILARRLQTTAFTNSNNNRLANISCGTDYQSYTRSNTGLSLVNDINAAQLEDGLSGPFAFRNGQRDLLHLDVYHSSQKGMRKVGTWNFFKHLQINKSPYDLETVFPLMNKVIRVVTVLQDPFVQEKIDAVDRIGRDKYEGFCIDMMEKIANASGFEWSIYVEKMNTYGTLEGSDWTGMVKDLLENKADIALGAFTISYIREKYIDFTKPFMNLGISILFKKPKGEKPGLFSFLNPLATVIWLYVMVAYLVVTLVIYTIARFSPYEWVNPHPCEESDYVQNSFTLSNSFWFALGTLMNQGSEINPRAVSTRIVGGIWWFFTLIIISSYTANLAAFLTIENKVSPIENAEDLSRQDMITYGALRGGSTMSFFKNSHIPMYRRMWSVMKAKTDRVLTSTTKEGIQRVKEENYAFLMESAMIEYYKERDDRCELIQVGGLIDSKGYGIGVSPNLTSLQDELTLRILELQRDQVLYALENKWWRDSGSCRGQDHKGGNKAEHLDIHNVGGIFVVLAIGLVVAIITAIVEFVWNSRQHAVMDHRTMCQSMAEELSFALNCYGSSRRLRIARRKSSASLRHRSSFTGHIHPSLHPAEAVDFKETVT